jgi:hypothetical protein
MDRDDLLARLEGCEDAATSLRDEIQTLREELQYEEDVDG